MTWSSRASIQILKTAIDRRSDFQVVLLQKHEVCIAFDTDVDQFDPLVIGDAHLLEELNKAVVVRDVRTGLACDHDVRHFAELCQLVDSASL